MCAPLDVTCRDLRERLLSDSKHLLLRRLVLIEQKARRPDVVFSDWYREAARGAALRLYRTTVEWLLAWRRGEPA